MQTGIVKNLLTGGIALVLLISSTARSEEGNQATLNIYHSNDLIGYLAPCG